MSTADILAKLIQKKREVSELEAQFYLALLNEQTRQAVDVEEQPVRRDQQRVVGIVCRCGDPVKILQNYKGKGDYYCCPNPKGEGCDYWEKAEYAFTGR